ncbi:unnamed protein product [Chrysodeixis includens]|uniref:Uncharacterized protein n=1 Tax=Chrysodeixis includens TaxID=689277 RepID=A0A9P0C1G8_CHRIL|nr:unnamed protein product [Chrysodeixis includens]
MYYRRCWAQTFDQTAKMSQRLDITKWFWCLLALHAGSLWGTSRSATKTPSNTPSTIEAQAKFFQYRNLPTADSFNQGHRLGSERHFTERHERAKPSEGLFSAKVRWGDKKGGYGEHYWDLNHAGNADNHGDDHYEGDNGSYHELSENDPYDEPSDNVPTYNNDEYDPEKSSYEEGSRAKRAHPKIKVERKHQKAERDYDEEPRSQKKKRKNKEQIKEVERETSQEEEEEVEDEDSDEDESYEKPKPRRQKQRKHEDNKPKDKKQIVLVVSHNDDDEKQQNEDETEEQTEKPQYVAEKQATPSRYVQPPPEPQYLPQPQAEYAQYPALPQAQNEQQQPRYFPYEGGAGVRHPEAAAATVPRLFFEAATGHVVDRATGQAYVLQPIAVQNNYN